MQVKFFVTFSYVWAKEGNLYLLEKTFPESTESVNKASEINEMKVKRQMEATDGTVTFDVED